MSITISREERDALYHRIIVRMSGINDVYRAIEEEDWEAAQRLGQEFSDLLRLICEDLEWGEGEGEEFKLNTPPDVLLRAAAALGREARFDREHFEDEFRDAEESVRGARYLEQACERILREVESR